MNIIHVIGDINSYLCGKLTKECCSRIKFFVRELKTSSDVLQDYYYCIKKSLN